jgi:hypothetical protein
VADGVAIGTGDRDAGLGTRAGGRGGSQAAGERGVEQAEALDLPGPLGQPEQRQQRDDQVRRPGLDRTPRRGSARRGVGIPGSGPARFSGVCGAVVVAVTAAGSAVVAWIVTRTVARAASMPGAASGRAACVAVSVAARVLTAGATACVAVAAVTPGG